MGSKVIFLYSNSSSDILICDIFGKCIIPSELQFSHVQNMKNNSKQSPNLFWEFLKTKVLAQYKFQSMLTFIILYFCFIMLLYNHNAPDPWIKLFTQQNIVKWTNKICPHVHSIYLFNMYLLNIYIFYSLLWTPDIDQWITTK